MTTCTKEHLLSVARSQIGVKEEPRGSNNVKYNTWYYGHPVSGTNYAWCAVGVSWVAAVAHATDIIPKHAYTPSGVNWFKAHGRFGKTPHVGSIVYYQFPGFDRVSHCGIVEVVHADGSWTAIEFNTDDAGSRTGGQVMRKRRYSVGSLGGFGNPAYAPSTPKPSTVGSHIPAALLSVKAWQRLLEFAPSRVDGQFGPDTLQRSEWMRTAARKVKGNLSGTSKSTIELIQRIIDTPDDGAWGPNSRRKMADWVKDAQRFLGVAADGQWGPNTDAAYLAFRRSHYRK